MKIIKVLSKKNKVKKSLPQSQSTTYSGRTDLEIEYLVYEVHQDWRIFIYDLCWVKRFT